MNITRPHVTDKYGCKGSEEGRGRTSPWHVQVSVLGLLELQLYCLCLQLRVCDFLRLFVIVGTWWQLCYPNEIIRGHMTLKADLFIGPESDHWLCLSLTDSLTDWLTDCRLVKLMPVTTVTVTVTVASGMWRWQLKTCWRCYCCWCWWWETVYSVSFRIKFFKVVESFPSLESDSITFLLQLFNQLHLGRDSECRFGQYSEFQV